MDVVGGDWKSVANAGAGVMTGMSSKSSKGLSGKGVSFFCFGAGWLAGAVDMEGHLADLEHIPIS